LNYSRLSQISSQSSTHESSPTDQEAFEQLPVDLPEQPQKQFNLNCWFKTKFFVRHALRDVKRNKCLFVLAFSSVFVVELSMLLVNTVINQGPILFFDIA
jgi:hypothetical protein